MLTKKYDNIPQVQALYEYTDIADGTGNESFYFCITKSSTGTDYILTNQPLYSREIESYNNILNTTGVGTPELDYDFDLTAFNTPRTIQGTAIVEVGALTYSETAATSDTIWIYYTLNLYKVSGGTEDLIGTGTSETFKQTGQDAITKHVFLFPVALTQKHFKIGDNLRANLQLYASGAGTGNAGAVYTAHDPAARDGTYVSGSNVITSSRVIVPFKLDL
jgi:hypothetical protein